MGEVESTCHSCTAAMVESEAEGVMVEKVKAKEAAAEVAAAEVPGVAEEARSERIPCNTGTERAHRTSLVARRTPP